MPIKTREGAAWLVGLITSVFMLLLFIIIIERYIFSVKLDYIDDAITASALGGLVYETSELALGNGKVISPDASYTAVCDILSRTVGCSSHTGCEFSSDGKYFAAGVPCIELYEVYNVKEDGSYILYSYTHSDNENYVRNVTTGHLPVTAYTGEEVTDTGVCILFGFPIKCLGFEVRACRGGYYELDTR